MHHEKDLKITILETIFARFGEWSKPFGFACERGCAYCCTQNVSITAVEAKLILDYLVAENMQQWLTTKLSSDLPPCRETITTNQFAQSCLEGDALPLADSDFDTTCPFLDNDLCMIYPVRPFSCRCFSSTTICRRGGSAAVPPFYLSAATAVSQVIEHLGQFSIWGNMLHVLYILGCEAAVINPDEQENKLTTLRECCATARPLPGFLLDESEYDRIAPLLESIFTATVEGRSIEDILNSR